MGIYKNKAQFKDILLVPRSSFLILKEIALGDEKIPGV